MQITTQDQEVILEQVKSFAAFAHGDQRRKYSDEPYVYHVFRVMNTCYLYHNSLPVLAAALLHDVLEDTTTTPAELKRFLDKSIPHPDEAAEALKLVVELTDVFTKKNYSRLNRKERKRFEHDRLATVSADAQTIKYADILDNVENVAAADPDFAPVLIHEYADLLQLLTKGEQHLYRQVQQKVADTLAVVTKS
jgi:guanosine-3',5'-bis(diphosphate) 3'-pyrophosphohydrolase